MMNCSKNSSSGFYFGLGVFSQPHLEDKLFTEDSVTGNGSGSYTFDQIKAEQNLVSNWELLREAKSALSTDFDPLTAGPEACDVLIRCYLLPEAIDLALQKLL